MHIDTNIRTLRKRRGWTQRQLAQRLDKAYITIGDYERGKALPPLNLVLELCNIFEVDIATLVLRDIEKEKLQKKTATDPQKELETLQRLVELQDYRLAELEREIRAHAPELARKLGLG